MSGDESSNPIVFDKVDESEDLGALTELDGGGNERADDNLNHDLFNDHDNARDVEETEEFSIDNDNTEEQGLEGNDPLLQQSLELNDEEDGGGGDSRGSSRGKISNPLSDNENSSSIEAGGGEGTGQEEEKGSSEGTEIGGEGVPASSHLENAGQEDQVRGGDEPMEIDDEKDDGKPEIQLRTEEIFEDDDDDDDVVEISHDNDQQQDSPPDIGSMLQMDMEENGESTVDTEVKPEERLRQETSEENEGVHEEVDQSDHVSSRTGRPKRAAAISAAETIKDISSGEVEVDRWRRKRSSKEVDSTYSLSHAADSDPPRDRHYCHVCKQRANHATKIQQEGTRLNIYFCGEACLIKHRQTLDAPKDRLPCAKCGTVSTGDASGLATAKTYYWETMTFCSDVCVGNYQVDVGGKCSTCTLVVPWLSLGKYCVRFGSDIRQFCSAPCLESFKKNARVCFHCQVDIKKLENVLLASLPGKQSPKEFCSQECVEMYVDQNLQDSTGPKTLKTSACVHCGLRKPCYRELVLSTRKPSNYKTCSFECWSKILKELGIDDTRKCQTCDKCVNADFRNELPSNCIATHEKVYGFCSAACKNVFVLKNRQILACIQCKVKKYNYDLILFYQGNAFTYATCSLNCLPLSENYITRLRDNISRYSQGLHPTPPVNTAASLTAPGANSLPFQLFMDNLGNIVASRPGEQPLLIQPAQNVVAVEPEAQVGSIVRSLTEYGLTEEDEAEANEEFAKWDGIFRTEDIHSIIGFIQEHMKCIQRSNEAVERGTNCRPKVCTASTQTEESSLQDMERVPLRTITETNSVPFLIPVPLPVCIPVPSYLMETPVPVPTAVAIPVPIPIPVSSDYYDYNPPSAAAEILTEPQEVGNTADQEKTGQLCPSSGVLHGHTAEGPGMSPSPASSSAAGKTSSESGKKTLTRVDYALKGFRMAFLKDPLDFEPTALSDKLTIWVQTGKKVTGERYKPDLILYLSLGIQEHLKKKGRKDSIFYDSAYKPFVEAITSYAESSCAQGITPRVEDKELWESQELGDHSPGILLFTLVYLFYKHFRLKDWHAHKGLHFSQIKIERRYHEQSDKDMSFLKITSIPEAKDVEVMENLNNRERCPIRLYQLYITKCVHADGLLYKAITSDPSDSIWYEEKDLDEATLYQLVVRVKMMKLEPDQ